MPLSSLTRRLNYSRWLWKMGASGQDSVRLLISYNSRPLRRRLGLLGVSPVTVHLRVNGATLPFQFSTATDFTVLQEVFRERQYEIAADLRPRTIVDLGSNTGLSSLFFRALFPEE